MYKKDILNSASSKCLPAILYTSSPLLSSPILNIRLAHLPFHAFTSLLGVTPSIPLVIVGHPYSTDLGDRYDP